MIERGDMREVLARLEPDSVHCAVFSPPFWNLRKYPDDTQTTWPLDDGECEHDWSNGLVSQRHHDKGTSTLRGSNLNQMQATSYTAAYSTCSRCGRWRGQLGLEPTVTLYIEHLMECMEAVRRVLRPEGVCFVELGDSFWGGNKGQGGYSKKQASNRGSRFEGQRSRLRNQDYLKPKDLCLVPARFSLACQEQGWWVRSIDPTETIAAPAIWHRPNPMPESVKTRPTVDFTFVFLLTKSEHCWYDQEAEREPLSPLTLADSRNDTGRHTHKASGYGAGGPLSPGAPGAPSWYRAKTFVNPAQGRNLRAVWSIPTQPLGYNLCRGCKRVYNQREFTALPRSPGKRFDDTEMRGHGWENEGRGVDPTTGISCNQVQPVCRCGASDWISHFATMPEALVARCLRLGCPTKCCASCQAGWRRILQLERGKPYDRRPLSSAPRKAIWGIGHMTRNLLTIHTGASSTRRRTVAWHPSCMCCQLCDRLGVPTKERLRLHESATRMEEKRAGRKIPQRPGVSSSMGIPQADSQARLSPMWSRLQGPEGGELLQPQMLYEVDVEEPPGESFPTSREGAICSRASRGPEQNHKATQAGHGAEYRAAPPDQRACASSERRPQRQSNRESSGAHNPGTRQGTHDQAPAHDLVPYPTQPGLVLDPFFGAGTVGVVAEKLGLRWIGCEMSEEYCRIAERRLQDETGLGVQEKLALP